MAQTIIGISTPNDGLGDPLRVAMDLQNGMNTELYNAKVDKVLGKELSSNDYTSSEKSKLAGIEAGAQVNVPADWNTLLNKPAELNNSVGYFYYDNTITALSFLAGVEKKLTNNKLGTETDVTHPPYGVTSLWDSTTNALDFSQLNVGDSVDLRLDHETTTTINNQEVKIFVRVGIGSANPKDIVFNHSFAKTSGAQGSESSYVSFPIITEDVRDYPAELYVKSIDDGSILVGGFFIRAIRSGLNIIDVVVEDDAPSDGTLYGRKNATWEAVPSGGRLGLIKIVDKAGDFFTDLATAQAYVRTFKASGFTDESFSNGTFWFTVPNGSSFGLLSGFLTLGSSVFVNAYIEDVLGLITTFSSYSFENNNGNNIFGNCTFLGTSFELAGGSNSFGNCTFGDGGMFLASGINKFKNILLANSTDAFAEQSTGRFEIYGNIGTTEGANYTNFFFISTAVIWAQKAKETSNAGGIEGDLATAQTNGAKLFFGYANAGVGGGTLDGLTDAEITTPLNNQVLAYETSSLLWKNKTLTTADIADSADKRYQTDNQQTYNDATSSIQTQLNALNPLLKRFYYDDFVSLGDNGLGILTVTGATLQVEGGLSNVYKFGSGTQFTKMPAELNRDGILRATIGNINGNIRIRHSNLWIKSTDSVVFASNFRIQTLSTGAERYTLDLRLFIDNNNFITCRYSDNINSGNFQFITSSSSVTTTVNTAVNVAINTWYELEIRIINGVATLFINGVAELPISTNILLNKSYDCQLYLLKTISQANASRTVDFDYLLFKDL